MSNCAQRKKIMTNLCPVKLCELPAGARWPTATYRAWGRIIFDDSFGAVFGIPFPAPFRFRHLVLSGIEGPTMKKAEHWPHQLIP